MVPTKLRTLTLASAATLALTGVLPAQAQAPQARHRHGGSVSTVTDDLVGPRGVAVVSPRKVLVAQMDGTFSLVVRRHHRPARVLDLGHVPDTGFAPAIAFGRHHTVWILTGGGEPGSGSATLYRWRPGQGDPTPVADIAAYQATDPDPYDLEDFPADSNPFGVAALRDGTVLVSDAAGNDLLRVWPKSGHIETVARLKPRTVPVPDGLPVEDPEGNPLPPAGTMIPSEAVATSVTVGRDGSWYVGELRGFPATPGTSQVWRIRPGTTDAVCDPEHPYQGACKRYADGLTSIVDLGAGRRSVYVVTLSKLSWLQMELGTPGAEIGGLFRLRHHGTWVTELAAGQLVQPGGVDVARDGSAYVTGPVFGPGRLLRIR